ncbi:hypothetical protein N8014_03200 [Pseudomonadota bacterium]|nr:hypothetical protein [Pseudomonadota bacterium]
MLNNKIDKDKLFFRRLIILVLFLSLLNLSIPHIFNFEQYYGLSRFVDQGLLSFYLNEKVDLYLSLPMSILSLISFILIYLFKPIGRLLYLINLILNLIIIMFSGDVIEYGLLYPLGWFTNALEALTIYIMYFGAIKEEFNMKNKDTN